jgi:geranylgeranyl diphosphate synthase type 3
MEWKKFLLEPFDYILKSSGKQIRSKLVKAFNEWLDIPHDYLVIISDVIEMLHNASLLIDDIEDNSVLRRGSPTAHTIYGVASTLNSANYVYFLALEKIRKYFPPDIVYEAVDVFSNKMLELHLGQGLEIYWRDNFVCPTENEYIDMIRKKTGGLFNMSVLLMQLVSQDMRRSFSHIVELMGMFFQIRDDYANLLSQEYADNKTYGEDLTEGKFSFPVIHAIHANPGDSTLLNIIKQRTKDIEIKKDAVQLMRQSGSLDYTKKKLETLEQELRKEIDSFGGNILLTRLLDELSVKKLDQTQIKSESKA